MDHKDVSGPVGKIYQQGGLRVGWCRGMPRQRAAVCRETWDEQADRNEVKTRRSALGLGGI